MAAQARRVVAKGRETGNPTGWSRAIEALLNRFVRGELAVPEEGRRYAREAVERIAREDPHAVERDGSVSYPVRDRAARWLRGGGALCPEAARERHMMRHWLKAMIELAQSDPDMVMRDGRPVYRVREEARAWLDHHRDSGPRRQNR